MFSGIALEQYFKAKMLASGEYTRIGGWWDRKSENEIDLVCENELTGALGFYEVKVDHRRYDAGQLGAKVEAFFRKHPEMRERKYLAGGLSLRDM